MGSGQPGQPGVVDWRTRAALALAQVGEVGRARELNGEVVELSRRLGQPRCLGTGLRAAGIIAGGAEGVELLREAVATLENTPARLEHARALVDLGAALRHQNHQNDAREPLREGTELAQRCGATVLAQRGQAELIATGARPKGLARSGVEALTPSERRIARLAANGLSTPEIAQQLFVTINTVETHLRHTYTKLDIHPREQLPGVRGPGWRTGLGSAAPLRPRIRARLSRPAINFRQAVKRRARHER